MNADFQADSIQARALEYYATRFNTALAVILDTNVEVMPGQTRVEVDGLTFEAVLLSDSSHLRLLRRCEDCNALETYGGIPIFNQIDLAETIMESERLNIQCSACRQKHSPDDLPF
jgi:hypothetical protein